MLRSDARPVAHGQPSVGIGWRHGHHAQVLEQAVDVDFLEVHSENFFGQGGAARAVLLQGRQRHPISLHGVGLSLGSAAGIDPWHLDQLAQLVALIEPVRVSDHACFARANGPWATGQAHAVHVSDLLPIAFDDASLAVLCTNVQRVQDRLGRTIAVENLSAYVAWAGDTTAEAEFLSALSHKTGCGLLVDVNNLYVNALNAAGVPEPGSEADEAAQAACRRWLDSVSPHAVAELHLAGHTRVNDEHGCIVIDDHGSRVPAPVWGLATHALQRFGPVPMLIEWDTDLPDLSVLLGEAQTARALAQPVTAPALIWPFKARTLDNPSPATADAASQPTVRQGAELQQQQASLVQALFEPALKPTHLSGLSPIGPKATVWRGLQAYRSNGHAIAERALQAAYPVLAQLLGQEALALLSRALWHSHPPVQGDLAQWGSALADFLRMDHQLAEWPYLSDVAAVEWLLHSAAAQADAAPDANSLQALLAAPPETVVMVLAPGTALFDSPWPVVSIWQAHVGAAAQASGHSTGHSVEPAEAAHPPAEPDWAHLRLAIAQRHAQTALVWREGLRPRCRLASTGEAALLRTAIHGGSLFDAVSAAAMDPGFSLQAWLPAAWHSGLLLGLASKASTTDPLTAQHHLTTKAILPTVT